ncbi:hypothetical protein J5226_07035 [Lysobacter sp. K5869]|uniref:hypothetical protein n=1 Tax=Lysobacter sp. K5869 TaxID=2820808 RepID=UPI001C05F0C9|nr:hypothetical protein [Lysobacter sp. K5869]QWP78144.1 hypothetical protein J5226_07035 [Lysobacter sp. K5869]
MSGVEILDRVDAADGCGSVEFVRRGDGSYGYRESDPDGIGGWRCRSQNASRFDSLETARAEAASRIAWLRRELAWPARDLAPVAVEQPVAGLLRCAYCGISFSLSDQDRWGGGRHLRCGQRLIVMAAS